MKAEFNAVSDLLDGELEDYGIEWDIEDQRKEGIYHYFDITITNAEQKGTNSDLRLRVENEEDIEVDMAEDVWEKVAIHNTTIKNLWIALLWR